jgi:hypothetical protein
VRSVGVRRIVAVRMTTLLNLASRGRASGAASGATHNAAIRAARRHAHAPKAKFLTWICTG